MKLVCLAVLGGLLAACGGSDVVVPVGADLSGFPTARIEIDGQPFEVWVAETPAQQTQGLMNAAPSQLLPAPDGTPRGMLFVFPSDQLVAFTMKDTWIPLDLAHFSAAGELLEVHELQPLVTTPVWSSQAVRYSLEVRSGDLAAYGLAPGSALSLPIP